MTIEATNDCPAEVERAVTPEPILVPQRNPLELIRGWWAKQQLLSRAHRLWQGSPVRAVLRFIIGIPQDIAAGENFMRQVLIFSQNITAKLEAHIRHTEKMGAGLNEVGNYAHEVELMVRHLARNDDRLRRSLQVWDENQERKRKIAEAQPDGGIVNAAGAVIASAGTESVEQAVEDLQPKIVEISPIHGIRKPSNN